MFCGIRFKFYHFIVKYDKVRMNRLHFIFKEQ